MSAPSVLDIETACLLGWPALETIAHLSWKARFARGYTKRANSIQAFDPEDGDNAALRIQAMAGEYRARGRQPIFRITPLVSPKIGAELDARAWDVYEPSLVLTAPAATKARAEPTPARFFTPTDPAWSEMQTSMAGSGVDTLEILRLILPRIDAPAGGLILDDEDGRPAAAALAVVANGIGLYFNVVVDPDRRGLGLGRAIMNAALNWAEANGARHHAIQVLAANAQAVPLYRSLGFAEAYAYHYRRDRS